MTQSTAIGEAISPPPTVSELCTLLVFLLDVIPLVGALGACTQSPPSSLQAFQPDLLTLRVWASDCMHTGLSLGPCGVRATDGCSQLFFTVLSYL